MQIQTLTHMNYVRTIKMTHTYLFTKYVWFNIVLGNTINR